MISGKTFAITCIVIILSYILNSIFMFYDLDTSYLGSYISFYIFMLISSLILPNDNFEINYIEEEKIETKGEDPLFIAELGKGRGSNPDPISASASSASDTVIKNDTDIALGLALGTPLSVPTTTGKSIRSHIDDGIALALSLIGK
jgi:hypothetical protein